MAITADYNQRTSSNSYAALEDRFEVIKDIGDGSFGSVALARVRANGASIARRGTMVCVISTQTRPRLTRARLRSRR